ncbi:MAG: PfkB family carbohydrate kinase [Bacteroidetes bacterium]|nr:PfkB family carbohydrate kinase [Bacteroidota bacterium]MDA0950853.1 PfkB family carbohydrate kinase [Bacteroidota bacterium]
MSKLLAVGTLAYDAIETPFDRTEKTLGGSVSYIALAASHFNVNIGIVSVIGGDFEEKHLELLRSKNIDLSGVEKIQEGKTFFWSGRYHNDMNSRDTLVTELNTLADFDPKVPENFKDAEVLLLGNLHPSIQLSVLDQMHKRPNVVILDTMNYWIEHTPDELELVLKRIDILAINEEEARQLSGEYSLVKAAKKILEKGPSYLIIKKGEHGALLFHQDQVFFAPALPLEDVYDPTGAGDTFAGGLAGYLTESRHVSFDKLKSALIHGANLASFCVEKIGTERMETLERKEIAERLEIFKTLTQCVIELD